MGRIIFVNRYFLPDHSATSQILGDLAFNLAASGREVHVIAGNQLYNDSSATLPAREKVNGVHVHRVGSTRFGRSALFGRAIDYLSLYYSLSRAALQLTRGGDVLVAKTDPPLLSVLMAKVALRRGARLFNWLQDLYPEVAVQLGVPLLNGLMGRQLIQLRDRSLKCAEANVVLGTLMAERLAAREVQAERIKIVHNWADEKNIRPLAAVANPLRKQWGLEPHFVVGYSGNLGRAHEFETLLDAAEHLKHRSDIVFLFVGGGVRVEALRRSVEQRGLERNFIFKPYQERSVLNLSLAVPDVHWVSLRRDLEGLIVPSKIYGILAAGRPAISVGAHDGEVARMLQFTGSGLTIEPGDSRGLAKVVSDLADDPAWRDDMGRRGREAAEHRYSRQRAFEQWQELLDGVSRQDFKTM